MKCSICYIEFINPKEYSKEAFDALFKGETTTHNNFDPDKFMRFTSLIIQKDNNPFKCNTPNCEHLYCVQCYTKIKQGENVEDEWDYGKKDTFQYATSYKYSSVIRSLSPDTLCSKNVFFIWHKINENIVLPSYEIIFNYSIIRICFFKFYNEIDGIIFI